MRSPRYALALLFGATYFFFVFGGPQLFHRSTTVPSAPKPTDVGALGSVVGYLAPLLLALFTVVYWLAGRKAHAILLTPAEASFLVPAPISRRRLLQYKLFSAQPAILFSAMFMTIMLRHVALPWYMRFPGVWLILTIMQLHQTGASLVHAGIQDQGRAAWKRVWPVTLIFLAALPIIVTAVVRGVTAMRAANEPAEIGPALDAIFKQPPVSIVLAPYYAVIAPLTSASAGEWIVSLAIAFCILIVHYYWVLSSDAAFEEGAVEAGARMAAALEAMRQGKRPNLASTKPRSLRAPWFAIPSTGVPAYAIWWKNMLQFTRALSPVLLVLALLLPGAMAAMAYSEEHTVQAAVFAAGLVLLIIGAVLTVMLPIALRNDLRGDLRRIELLRTLPVEGTSLVIAEIAAASFTCMAIQLLLIGVGGALTIASGEVPRVPIVLALALPGAIFLVAVNLILLIIHNGFALFFPAWVRMRTAQPGGIEFLGQNIMLMLGSVILFVAALVPPIVAGAVTGGTMALQMGRLAAVPAVAVFFAVLYVEIFMALKWLGNGYDRIDPVEAGLCQ